MRRTSTSASSPTHICRAYQRLHCLRSRGNLAPAHQRSPGAYFRTSRDSARLRCPRAIALAADLVCRNSSSLAYASSLISLRSPTAFITSPHPVQHLVTSVHFRGAAWSTFAAKAVCLPILPVSAPLISIRRHQHQKSAICSASSQTRDTCLVVPVRLDLDTPNS